MGKVTFILGGARSGKSTYAEKLALAHRGRVTYIATAEALDDEMFARIEKHKKARPGEWKTREIPRDLAKILQENPIDTDVVLLDCLTLWASNLLLRYSSVDDDIDEEALNKTGIVEIEELFGIIEESKADWIIVSNEVGSGLVPPYPMGRVYRDLLGRVNQAVAARADEVFFIVAGIAVQIHRYRDS
ncbi:MAG: bifunctional adenosylcobinamide kinase/adenosylcobinamide-phosphate guanylyltransferase [Anaerolineales bacterium]|jgi:adenosylcobinamide kinase/adenosylcobinamide-phosphate guanylyltransferase